MGRLLLTLCLMQTPADRITAEIHRATATTLAQTGKWSDALSEANRAVVLAPEWADAYFTRAGIRVGLAGPKSETAKLAAPEDLAALERWLTAAPVCSTIWPTGRTVCAKAATPVVTDFNATRTLLLEAAADLTRYLELTPNAADRAKVILAAGELQARARLAELAAARSVAILSDVPEVLAGKVRTAEMAGHWCFPGQVWSANRCTGIPTGCPVGFGPSGETCAMLTCPAGRQHVGIHCCWSGQVWSEEKGALGNGVHSQKGCTGIPRCPKGTFAVGELCVPEGKWVADTRGGACDGAEGRPHAWRYELQPPDGYDGEWNPLNESLTRAAIQARNCVTNQMGDTDWYRACCP